MKHEKNDEACLNRRRGLLGLADDVSRDKADD